MVVGAPPAAPLEEPACGELPAFGMVIGVMMGVAGSIGINSAQLACAA